MKAHSIAITGGSGFVGTELTKQLQQQGHQVICLSRTTEQNNTVQTRQVDYNDQQSIAAALHGCDTLIHLIGILHQNKHATFSDIHHRLVLRLLQAAQNAGVNNYLHMSALGADHSGPSQYLKSKQAGESAAFEFCRQHNIRMLSFRPSIIFGSNDNFFNQFARILRYSPLMPLICPQAQFQPVSVSDVAAAFTWAVTENKNGETYELAGVEILTMHQIIKKICQHYGWKRLIIPLPDCISRWQAKIMQLIPNSPLSYDNYLSLQKPNTSNNPAWETLNISPQPIDLEQILSNH